MSDKTSAELIANFGVSGSYKFGKYAEARIEELHKKLEISSSLEDVHKIQGRIAEVRRLVGAFKEHERNSSATRSST